MKSALARIGPRPLLLVHYVAFQIVARLRRRVLARRYDRLVVDVPEGARLRPPAIDMPAYDELPTGLRVGARRIRIEADAALAHTVDLLGSGPVDLGGEVDWHRDFKSGYRWPANFYQDLEVTRLTDDSDAKVPWELSRGHHFVALARAAVLYRDERYAVELERQLDAWIAANPPGVGINWVTAMEVGIRATSWLWAIGTLERWRPMEPDLRARVTRSLQSHARHIAHNLEGTPYLRSNHFLANILGLLVIGCAVDGDRSARRWRRFATRAFEREIHRQVLPDGASFEASLSYHGLALEIFTVARWSAAQSGISFSAAYDRRLRRMIDVSRATRHPDGRIPAFGDGDSGRILPVTWARPPTHDGLLWLAAAALELDAPLAQPPDDMVAWTFGLAAWTRTSASPVAGSPPRAFPHAGLYVLDGGGSHLVVRCGDVGQNGSGGHAHNDMLSYELSRGPTFIVDSGTYLYTADPQARNAHRGSAAHNVVVLAGEEANAIDADQLFRLRQTAHVEVSHWSEDDREARFVGLHDGYARLPHGVIHRRTIVLDRGSGGVDIRDELLGSGPCDAVSYVHAAAGVHVDRGADGAFVLTCAGERLAVEFSHGFESTDVSQGWVSDRFGRREPAAVLAARVQGELPLTVGYRLGPRADAVDRAVSPAVGEAQP